MYIYIAYIALITIGFCLVDIIYRAYGAKDGVLLTEALLTYIGIIVYIICRFGVR